MRTCSLLIASPSAGFAGLVKRPLVIGRNSQDPCFTLDHNVARVGCGRPHQGDPTTPRLDLRPHPFGAATGLAKAASSHEEPYPPGSFGRQLFGPGSVAPMIFERIGFAGRLPFFARPDPV